MALRRSYDAQINDVFAEKRRIASCRAPAVALRYGSAPIDNDAQINDVFAGKKRIFSCRAPVVALLYGLRISITMRRSTRLRGEEEDRLLQSSNIALLYGSAQINHNAQSNDVFAAKTRTASRGAQVVALLYGFAHFDNDAQINAVFTKKKRIASCSAPEVQREDFGLIAPWRSSGHDSCDTVLVAKFRAFAQFCAAVR